MKPTIAGSEKRRKNFLEVHPLIAQFVSRTQQSRNRDYQVKSEELYDTTYKRKVFCFDIYTELDLPMPYSDRADIKPKKMVKFRAHPDYKGEGAWYDFAVAEYPPPIDPETGEESTPTNEITYQVRDPKTKQLVTKPLVLQWDNNIYPVKILGFVKGKWRESPNEKIDPNQPQTNKDNMTDPRQRDELLDPVDDFGKPIPWSKDEDYFALVHGCVDRDGDQYEFGSVLTESWHLEYGLQKRKNNVNPNRPNTVWCPILRWIRIAQIVDRVFVVEESPGIPRELPYKDHKKSNVFRSAILLRKYEEWWLEFIY